MNLSVVRSVQSADTYDSFFECDGKIGLLYSNHSLTPLALYGITLITTEGYAVWVLDGANSFNAYFVARLARRWGFAPEPVLDHIKLSRAFTCYQMKELATQRLESVLGPPQQSAIFCLGLLDTFYDEDVKIVDAVRMIKMISTAFTELAKRGYTILITCREPRAEQKDRVVLLNLLKESAQRVERIRLSDAEPAAPIQLPLLLNA
ncbi:hypothetical protein ANRL3_02169 [Anaerolineae bacterium]|nr:hypothetical protein ANRL3_02169 [Anaerolineae bacterium]